MLRKKDEEIPLEPPIQWIPIWIPPKDNKKISVTIGTFNRPALIVKAVNSILDQTTQDFHLYIIDNNSIPQVQKVLKQWVGNPQITIYTTTMNEEWRSYYWGYQLCNLKGFSLGNEPYIATLSDDCRAFPNKLKELTEALEKHPEWNIVHGIQICMYGNGQVAFTRGGTKVLDQAAHYIDSNQIIYTRKFLNKVLPYFTDCRKHMQNPDLTFCIKCTEWGEKMYPVQVLTENFLMHKFHDEYEKDKDLRE